jgi:Ca-activated chloride channel family protein
VKVDTRYLVLGGIGFILIAAALLSPKTIIDNQTSQIGEPAGTAKIGSLKRGNVTIEGAIIDGYVDVIYSIRFDNTASPTPSEVEWLFGLQEGIRLSNVSIEFENITYWGRVMPEQQAIEEYEDEVEANESALLVIRVAEGYRISFNLENGTEARVGVRVEGLLTRKLGLYSLNLPIADGIPFDTSVDVDISIRSSFEGIAGYSISGLPEFTASDLSDGVRIEYYSSGEIPFEELRIKYSLDRQLSGSQLLTFTNGTDNFYAYLLAPSITEVSDSEHRQYVFILDKSGSMSGLKIDQAKAAFNSMVELLLPTDLFNVITFDTNIASLWYEPHSASETNVDEAQAWINGVYASGNTNFHGAMMEALDMMLPGDNVKAILMLSDGQPTAGEITTTNGILDAVSAANDLDVSISSVAFGSDANENLMANLAAQNSGFFAFIQPSEEAATDLIEFYYEFSTPIAESYSVEFSGTLDSSTLMPLEDSPFFNGSEVLVCGRYGSSMSVVTTIDYPSGTEVYTNSAGAASTENAHVEKLWAQQRINYLLRLVQLEGETSSIRDEIVSLGMCYGIIVEGYTALLITTDYVEAEHTDTTYDYPPPGTTSTTTWAYTTGTTTIGTYGAPAFDATSPILGFVAFPIIFFGIIGIFLRKRRS